MKSAGALGRENVGMSNHKRGESPLRRKPKVSSAMSIIGGLGVPKDNCAFGHGRPMDSRLIFRPLRSVRRRDGVQYVGHIIGFVSRVLAYRVGKSARCRKANASIKAKAARLKSTKRASKKTS